MTPTTEKKTKPIDNYDEFNEAILDIHRNITEYHDPSLEVSEKFFLALTKGKDLRSMTWGDPGVRIFKSGTMDEILSEENLPAEQYRDLEIKRKREAKKK